MTKKDIEDLNRSKYGDPGPFLVGEDINAIDSKYSDGFVSKCFLCNSEIYVPERFMTAWRNSGAMLVCSKCSHGKVGELLETFE